MRSRVDVVKKRRLFDDVCDRCGPVRRIDATGQIGKATLAIEMRDALGKEASSTQSHKHPYS